MTTKLIYIGNGAFLPGVPARDLSAKEADTLGRERLLASGLYRSETPAASAESPRKYDATKGAKEK